MQPMRSSSSPQRPAAMRFVIVRPYAKRERRTRDWQRYRSCGWVLLALDRNGDLSDVPNIAYRENGALRFTRRETYEDLMARDV